MVSNLYKGAKQAVHTISKDSDLENYSPFTEKSLILPAENN